MVTAWSQSIDLMPSILTHVGVPVPEGPQGRTDLLDAGFAVTFVNTEFNHRQRR